MTVKSIILIGGITIIGGIIAVMTPIGSPIVSTITGVYGYPVEEWEHGFKTSRVIATRYKNEIIGYNIGFDFPKDIDNADRAEVEDFMEAHKGWIYQGGGYPGATAYVKFEDVTDKESANKKLKEILPLLSQLMADMSAQWRIRAAIGH